MILPQVPIHSEAGDIMDVFPEDMILEPGELGAVSRGVMRAEDSERLNWYLRAILTANVYDVAVQSPLDAAPKMAEKYGVKIHLKREDLQARLLVQAPRRVQPHGADLEGVTRQGCHLLIRG